ncbi:hypothetical protein L1049_021250 [Liquidambar formosana]|uniref:Two-component response regulator n=1 Tax=Liquidambar formosana TaxID=63359 RepID=A0AAP0X4X3_LIQFO
MDGEIITPGQSSKSITSVASIHILVVDDDATSLSIVSGMLKQWRYEVMTVRHPLDALSTLRVRRNLFQLVITDVHMPDMDGFELQKQVDEEFQLPVIMISGDDKESVMIRGLESGAVFFILKPINPIDLKHVWQYAVAARRVKSIVIEETGSVQGVTTNKRILYEDRESASSVNEERRSTKRDYKKKPPRKGNDDGEEDQNDSKTPKKAKVVWTTRLHNQFLNAIKQIGLEKAVPKRILEFMDEPGLTRENIASHLQKYRIFLKKVTEKTNGSSKNLSERALRSSFALGHSPLTANNHQQEYSQSSKHQQMRTTFQPRFGANIPVHNTPSLGPACFPNQEGSSSNSITQVGYGQSYLLSHQANMQQPMSRNTNHLSQSPNNIRTGLSSRGYISSGLMNGTNGLMTGTKTLKMYRQQTQARPENFTDGPSNYNFRTYGVCGLDSIPGMEHMGSFDSVHPIMSSNYSNNNYAGIQINGDGELVRLSYKGFTVGDPVVNGVNGNYGLTNAQMESGNFSCFTQGGSSEVGFEAANQFSPMFSNVIQQENASVQLPPQPNLFGNDGGETNYMFGPIDNTSNLDNIPLSQPFGADDLSGMFDQIHDQFHNQQQAGDEFVDSELYGTYQILKRFSDMMSGRCAACKYLRRRCPSDCIFSPYFPSDNPQRFACVHRIYGASNIGKMLQQLPAHLRAQAADSLYYEAQCRIRDPVYGCVGIISLLHQQLHNAESQLAKTRAEMAFLTAPVQEPQFQQVEAESSLSNFLPQQSDDGHSLSGWQAP